MIEFAILLAAALAGGAAAGVVGTLLVARMIHRPLESIIAVAADIAGGDLKQRVLVGSRRSPLDRLSQAINAMLDRIATLIDNLQQVSTDVAHDLRAPLTRIRSGLEVVAESDDPARLRAAVAKAIHEGDDLLALFGAILRIAEVERGGGAIVAAPVDLSEIASLMTDAYAPAVEDGGRSLRFDAPEPVPACADRSLLCQALANLLDNAQIHTPVGTAIVLSARCRNGAAVLGVADDGPGVSAGDRDRVVRRFARLDHSRGTPGHGLGLNMAAAIAHAHGGTFVLGDAQPGLVAEIVLPTANGD